MTQYRIVKMEGLIWGDQQNVRIYRDSWSLPDVSSLSPPLFLLSLILVNVHENVCAEYLRCVFLSRCWKCLMNKTQVSSLHFPKHLQTEAATCKLRVSWKSDHFIILLRKKKCASVRYIAFGRDSHSVLIFLVRAQPSWQCLWNKYKIAASAADSLKVCIGFPSLQQFSTAWTPSPWWASHLRRLWSERSWRGPCGTSILTQVSVTVEY